MYRFISIFLLVSLAFVSNAQSYSEIKSSPEYLWGEGEGETLRLADDQALVDLISQIAVHVSGEKSTTISNEQKGQNVKSQVSFEQKMRTYSSATLTNTERLVLSDEPTAKVFRYIKKNELDKIFEARKDKIKEMINVASTALEIKQIDDAIRYYYWANMLLNSLRPGEDVKVKFAGKEMSASLLIKNQLDEIFSNLKANFKGKQSDGNVYEVEFSYKGTPVASIDYTYWVGNDWSHVNTARDGKGLVELKPGITVDQLILKYECMYFNESQCDKEVNQVLETVKQIVYPQAKISIPVTEKVLSDEVNIEGNLASSQSAENATSSNDVEEVSNKLSQEALMPLVGTMDKIVQAIKSRSYASVQSYFTADGYDIFTKLINYGKARIIGNDMALEFTELAGYVYCRSIPMRFAFSGNRSFVENVVFVFEGSGKIDNISFGLSEVAQDDIFTNHNVDWSSEAKGVLQSFLENYKTAYALERLDYLESIFSEDALIISGKVVQQLVGNVETGYRNNRYVKLTKYNKSEYINRLKDIFRYNEFINIKFANNDVKKMGKGGEVYAVQIKQDYFSANYGDTGYLFLLVDVNDPDKPIIHVRAWQEQPDPSWGIIGPEHF
ncbi:MAG: LPP20 family lipoprotein [Muribaculaceae bacterium]|nr:LPP20 family lipoprotein [Muribaculaceae bacterium]